MGNSPSNGLTVPEIQEHLLEAVKQKNVEKALAAIDGGANINYIYRSSEGETNTILLTSIIQNDQDMVKMLVDKHVDPSFRDDLGWNALLYSCWEAKVSDELAKIIILYSIEKGYSYMCSRSTPLGYNPLHFACWQGKAETVETLLSRTNVNPDEPANGDYGVLLTPLNFACRYRQYPADEDHPDHRIELRKRRTVILNLINRNVNLDVVDETREGEGFTPLLQALRCTGNKGVWVPDFGTILYLLMHGASGLIESKPSRSAEDQDPISPKLLANHCISEADTPGRVDKDLYNRMSNVFEVLQMMEKVSDDSPRINLQNMYLQGQFLALMELCRRNYCLNAIDMSKVNGNVSNEDFVDKAISNYGGDISISKQYAFFVKGWPHTYAIAVKKRRSAKSIWELFNGEDAAKNKIDANLIVKASTKFRRLHVKQYISAQINKRIVSWHGSLTQEDSAKNVNTTQENAKWNEVILLLLKMPKRCFARVQDFLLNAFVKKAIRSINSSIAPEKTLGPYPGKMSDRLNRGGVPNLCGF